MEKGLTFEKVWAMFQETDKKFQETDRKFQETDRKFQETDRKFQETDRKFQETDRKFQEAREEDRKAREEDRKAREEDRKAREEDRKAREEDRKNIGDLQAELRETDRILKSASRQLGGIGNSNGAFAENYFYNSLDKTKMFGNEHFDHIDLNVKPALSTNKLQDEYDIVLLNGKSVAIIEVKYRATKEHIAQTIKKATTFRQFFPEYKDFTFYLGLAGFSFEEEVEQDALNAGLAVLKQVGDNLVVYDERIKKILTRKRTIPQILPGSCKKFLFPIKFRFTVFMRHDVCSLRIVAKRVAA